MSDVFVSYKAEDRRRVQPLVHALQADGYSVWWDEHIGTGDEDAATGGTSLAAVHWKSMHRGKWGAAG